MIHFTLPRVPPRLSKLRSANLPIRRPNKVSKFCTLAKFWMETLLWLFEAVRYECLIMNALRLCLWLDSTEGECLFH